MRRCFVCPFWTLIALGAFVACGDDDKPKSDVPDATDTTDTLADTQGDVADTGEPDTGEPDTGEPDTVADSADTTEPETIEPYPKPDYFPDDADADEVLSFPGVAAPVRVLYDDRGIPHIYGSSRADVLFVQGFVTARDRIFQMHTLRSAAKGRAGEFAGSSALAGDVLLRMLKLGSVAEGMAAATAADDPELAAAMNAYTAGVNSYIARMKAGLEAKPVELQVFGQDVIYDWTNADTMAIVRLQTWDLGFGGVVDELSLWEVLESLRTSYADTNLAGIELDVANFEPTEEVATLLPEGGANQAGSFDLGAVLDNPFFSGPARRGFAKQVRDGFEAMGPLPFHRFSDRKDDVPGSNNWVISGDLTENGRPIVSNDTHLGLRNPAIFYHVQLSTTLAGGDYNVGGVNFAGAPGIVLGHNDHAAWGATVFYSDVTDMYVEKLDATRTHVWFKGAWVELSERRELFEFAKTVDVACIDSMPAYAKNLEYTEHADAGRCHVELTVLDVPHHGPIIPWSFRTVGDEELAVSWKWTGFEPTGELNAVYRLGDVASFDDFKAALDRFGVGAQNWIYGGKDGDIGWYPSHNLPIRKHIAAGDYSYPPFLPMPGDTGDTEWEGFLPRAQIPQAKNPAQGYIITANADPVGVSFDNDPFNDGPYIGYAWDVGFREAQITRRINALQARSSSKITAADLQSVQGDHRSNLGAMVAPVIVQAIRDVALDDGHPGLQYLNAQVLAATDLLEGWAESDYHAASGVGDGVSDAEAKASAATAIFNVFLQTMLENALKDEGYLGLDRLGLSSTGRFLNRLFTKPETMASFDEASGTSPVWDDRTTTEVVETKEEIIAKSLAAAVAFLKDPEKVGVSNQGGFGTSDMTDWRWGKLHTVKLRHNITSAFDIPAPDVMPDGFPRPGDNFTVDACNPGFFNTSFTYGGGAAIRNVYQLTDEIVFNGVIPGGQSENPQLPHYNDEAWLWARNEAPVVVFTVEDVLAKRERTVDFLKAE